MQDLLGQNQLLAGSQPIFEAHLKSVNENFAKEKQTLLERVAQAESFATQAATQAAEVQKQSADALAKAHEAHEEHLRVFQEQANEQSQRLINMMGEKSSANAATPKKTPTKFDETSSSYFSADTFKAQSKDDVSRGAAFVAPAHPHFPGLGSPQATRVELYDISGLEVEESSDEVTDGEKKEKVKEQKRWKTLKEWMKLPKQML